jgi:hypothetical protein
MTMTPQEVLLLPMRKNDSGALTIGGYLQALLLRLWQEEEGFGGKRPFGNSCWKLDLFEPIAKALGKWDDVRGTYCDRENIAIYDQLIVDAIAALAPDYWAKDDAKEIAATVLRREADRLYPPDAVAQEGCL